jgi:hypothetical protein
MYKKIIDLITQISSSVQLPEFIIQFINNETKHIDMYNYEDSNNSNETLQSQFYFFSIEEILIILESSNSFQENENKDLFLLNKNNNLNNQQYENFLNSLSIIKYVTKE